MQDSVRPVLPFVKTRTAESGFALIFVMLAVGIIGVLLANYQLGKIRNTRYQTYFALGQDFANLARTSHAYAQDIAYYDPYVHENRPEEIAFTSYLDGLKTSKVAAFHKPLIDISGAVTADGQARFTMLDMQKTFPGKYDGYVDAAFNLDQPIRGIRYEFFAYGGLLPLRTVKDLQGASALAVLYGRPAGGPDLRNAADMAAFRAGAAQNGLDRIGIVLPASRRTGLVCHGSPAIVAWGNSDNDCLTSGEAGSIGMNLQPYDIVAPAWEAAEKTLVRGVLYRRPQPGIQDANIMYDDLKMDGTMGGGLSGHPNSILDASEIFTDTANVLDKSEPDTKLMIGDQTTGAPLGDAQLLVGRANNKFFEGTPKNWVCTKTLPDDTLPYGACIKDAVEIKGNLSVGFVEDTDTDGSTQVRTEAPEDIMEVKGKVEVSQGNVTVTSDPADTDTGYFDVTGGPLGGGATFKINGSSSGGNGTIINDTVKAEKYTIKNPTNTENFVIEDEIAIKGGNIAIGSDTTPSQVVFSSAPVENVSIDTTGKGANAGVYGANVDVNTFEQSGSTPVEFKSVDFQPSDSGAMSLNVTKNVIVDPNTRYKDNDCVGRACPDYVPDNPGSEIPF